MRALHLTFGLFGLAGFLATGVWMQCAFPGAHDGDGGMRMMFRSAHCYLFFAALLNLLVAAHVQSAKTAIRRGLLWTGSLLILAGPVLCAVAFCVEPAPSKFERPYVEAATVLALAGTILHLCAMPARDAT